MIKIICMAGIMILLSAALVTAAADSDLAEQQTAYLTEQLGLTDEQAVQAKDILTGSLQLVQINREKYKDDPEGMAAAMKEQLKIRNEQLQEILFDNQKEKFAEVLEALPGPRGDVLRRDNRLEELAERLNLNEQQVKQIGALFAAQEEEMRTEREQMQKDGPGDRSQMQDRREEMRAKMEEFNAKIEALLNDKQKAEYQKYLEEQRQEMESHRPPGGRGPGRR